MTRDTITFGGKRLTVSRDIPRSGVEYMELRLPGIPPSINRLWRAHEGRVIKSEEYRTWTDQIIPELRAQAGVKRMRAGYEITVEIGRPDKRRRDLDNIGTKALQDALVRAGIVKDDSLCQAISVRWVSAPGTRIILQAAEASA